MSDFFYLHLCKKNLECHYFSKNMTHISNLKIEGLTCTFKIHGDLNFANALRRSLLSDIVTVAPNSVTVTKNTSCMPDEYIAHRIGLVPFKRVGMDTTDVEKTVARICVHGRDVLCDDITSAHFLPCRKGTIMSMTSIQSIELQINFESNSASKHSRFLPIGPVSYKHASESEIEMSFTSITNESPLVYLRAALAFMQKRIHQAKYHIQKNNMNTSP